MGWLPGLERQVDDWTRGRGLLVAAGIWAATGIRGGFANAKHTAVRLAFDQTLENATDMGAPPTTWSPREQVVDVLHKTLYSVATGVGADWWIRPRFESHKGVTSH
jgi:hypothetical protein